VARARAGEGPSLVEAKTYRYHDHAEALLFAVRYREDDELVTWRSRDPIEVYPASLVQRSIASPGDVEDVRRAVDAVIDEAVEFGLSSPYPDPDEAYEGLYAEPITVRGRR
jgi:pyruvate dehydrogenase E1 component alpha subunit